MLHVLITYMYFVRLCVILKQSEVSASYVMGYVRVKYHTRPFLNGQ